MVCPTTVGLTMDDQIGLSTIGNLDTTASRIQSLLAMRSNRSKVPYTPTPFVLMPPRAEDTSMTAYSA